MEAVMHVLDELQARGFVAQCSDLTALREAMDAEPLTLYAGFDPTAASLHVGHLLPILMMTHLQRAGHRVVALVGGGTGMVGDPSGKTEARQLLGDDAVAQNAAALRVQLERFMDLSDPARGVVRDNAEWLLDLQLIPFLRDIGSCFSVNRMLTAEGYRMRLEKGLSFIEFNYQLLQAYDFLKLYDEEGCRLQVGGDDQWSNILAGLDLIRRKRQVQSFALTAPLLTTATGDKMGKTAAGALWLDADRVQPFDFFQYWVNVDDRDVGRFLRLYTFLPLDEITRLEALEGAEVREAKRVLAWQLTAMVHGDAAADQARDGAKAMVAGTAAEDLPTALVCSADLPQPVVALLHTAGLAKSRSEARRLIQQGGVRVGSTKLTDVDATLDAAEIGEGLVLRVGKKKAARLVVA